MISVIIPAKDAARTISECLQAVLHQDGMVFDRDYEVIVVDDGSTDNTADIAKQYKVKVVQQDNLGRAAARNAGVRLSRGHIVAFTDADCAPSPAWLKNLTQPFNNHEIVGIKGVYKTKQTSLVSRFVQAEYEYKYARMQNQTAIDFIDTYSAAYRKDVFLINKGFDEALPLLQDQELSFRIARKGYRMVFEPSAMVYHYHVQSFYDYLRKKYRIGYWKAVMLRWIPEKTFSDSHTAPTQRIEIGLIAILMVSIALCVIWLLFASISSLILLAVFLAITIPFQKFILKRDPKVLWVATFMLIGRAAALGLGLLKGFILPAKIKAKEFPCLSIDNRFIKRMIDITGGFIGLLFSCPVIVGTAIEIKLDDNGPLFTQQIMAGESGKPFKMYTIRTVVNGAKREVRDHSDDSQSMGPIHKTPEITSNLKVGSFLQRWNLDKLPQLWNVLKGDMSLVGPLPEELSVIRNYNDFQRQRLMFKPGLISPIPVNGREGMDSAEILKIELNYLRNYKPIDDLKIILRTLPAIVSGEGVA